MISNLECPKNSYYIPRLLVFSITRHYSYEFNRFLDTCVIVHYFSKEIHLSSNWFLCGRFLLLLTRSVSQCRLILFTLFGIILGNLWDMSKYSIVYRQVTKYHLLNCVLDTPGPFGRCRSRVFYLHLF